MAPGRAIPSTHASPSGGRSLARPHETHSPHPPAAAAPAVPGSHPAGRMSIRARSRLALACAAVFFGWPLIKHTPDALEALAFILGVNL